MGIDKSYKGHNIVFIVGCPRSGTTWIQRILAAHPKICTGQETRLFEYIALQLRIWRSHLNKNPEQQRGTGLGAYFSEEDFMNLLKEYMMNLLTPIVGSLRPGEIFIEKTPDHLFSIPEIKELLPESRFIHIVRDARDVAASLLAASRSWGSFWAPDNAKAAAWKWVQAIKFAQVAKKKLPSDSFLELYYEDLHSNTYKVLKTISQFLKIEWDDEELNKAIENNTVEAMREGRGTPIPLKGEMAKKMGSAVKEPKGFIRKGKPGGWKKDLSLWEKLIVWRVARSTMRKIGYPWLFPW